MPKFGIAISIEHAEAIEADDDLEAFVHLRTISSRIEEALPEFRIAARGVFALPEPIYAETTKREDVEP